MGNAVVFGNQKGGVGKTTLAVLYALWQADVRGQSVCLIDLDAQANATTTLRRLDCGLNAVDCFGASPLDWKSAASKGPLALVGGCKRLADVELVAPNAAIPAFIRNLSAARLNFDTVVIDTPPALGLRLSAALIGATHVVCPIELEEYSIDGLSDMLKTVFGIRRKYNPQLNLAGIVLNRFNAHSVRQKASMAQLVNSYSEFVIPARISTRSAIPEALSEGMPVWGLAKSSAREAGAEIRKVFSLLQERIVLQGAAASPKGCG